MHQPPTTTRSESIADPFRCVAADIRKARRGRQRQICEYYVAGVEKTFQILRSDSFQRTFSENSPQFHPAAGANMSFARRILCRWPESCGLGAGAVRRGFSRNGDVSQRHRVSALGRHDAGALPLFPLPFRATFFILRSAFRGHTGSGSPQDVRMMQFCANWSEKTTKMG